MGRKPCCEKVGLKKGKWTAEEDETLSKYIEAHGEGSWRSLPKNAGLLRCGKSCRLRWLNYLRGDLKRGNITPREKDLILQLHASLGNKWSIIAGYLPGRTDNEIKNYWNSYLSKTKCSFFTQTPESRSDTTDTGKFPNKRRPGRVRRSVAKKYNMNNNARFDKMPMRNPTQLSDTKDSTLNQTPVTVNGIPELGDIKFGPFEELLDGSGDSSAVWNLYEEKANETALGLGSSAISYDGVEIPSTCFSPTIHSCFDIDLTDCYQDDPANIEDEGEYAMLWPWETNNLEAGKSS